MTKHNLHTKAGREKWARERAEDAPEDQRDLAVTYNIALAQQFDALTNPDSKCDIMEATMAAMVTGVAMGVDVPVITGDAK